MKKILSLILALVAIATTAKAQTKFGIEVGGVQVTSANLSNITGGDIKSGTVKYNPTNRKLTLTNVKIERSGSGRRGIYNEKVGDLTIVFEGTNTITTDVSCALRCEAPTTLVLSANSTTTFTATKEVEAIYVTKGIELEIQGSDTGTGSLTVKANKEYAIEGDGKETIRFTKAPIVTLNGVQGNLVNLRNVIFNASSTAKTQVTLKAVGSAYSQVQNVTVWTEQGYSHIETPIGATFDTSKKTIVLNGEAVTGKVVVCEDVIPLDNSSKIPDANFRAYLKKVFAGGRNYLTYAEAQQVTEIDVDNKKIANLKGIEFFTALEYLDCENNQLTSLDVSNNTAMKTLRCNSNRLTSLNVSGCTALINLYCENNQLTSLNVSGCAALEKLWCYKNQLTALDVSNNNELEKLLCYDNQLTSLDVSGFTALTEFSCSGNQLTSLNVSGCTALYELPCSGNQLTSLNVSGCTELRRLYCENNQLTSLNVSGCTALYQLWCYGNQIKGDKMQALVESLPTVYGEYFYNTNFNVINLKDSNEGNVITKSQVAIANDKQWYVCAFDDEDWYGYEGSDPVTYELKLEPGLTIMTVSSTMDFAALWMAAMADVFNVESSKETGAVFKSKKTGKTLIIAGEGIVWVSADVTPEDNVTFDIPAAGRAELIKEFGEDLLSDYGEVTLSFVALPEKKDLTLSFPKKENTLEELNISEGSMEGIALYALLYWEKLQSFKDEETDATVFANMSGKNLFEMIDDKIIVCDGVTSADNIVYTITDKNREDFMKGMEMPFDIFTAYKTIQIKFEFGTTGIGAPLNDNGQRTNDSWYTIDGKRLQGEPTKKGVYIIKGKKVVKCEV